LHFFNPVHKIPLVEVAHAPATSQQVTEMLRSWVASLGKTPVVVKDSPGFLVNRVLIPYFNEAVGMINEGLSAKRIDEAMRRFGMPVGPLELLDQIGLDVAAHIARSVGPLFADRFPSQPAFEVMVEKNWLGVKTKAGFYRYHGRQRRVNHLAMNAIHARARNILSYQPEAASKQDQLRDIRDRLVGLMVNEAASCLEEGIAKDAATLDLAMVLGSGWAPHRGGPLTYAKELGIGTIVQSLIFWQQRLGERYRPSSALLHFNAATPGKPF
jgi:3-hydroxyacyl-CoA dehydrogenase/enoyl-CoA hydratase/3-hydroxybutyryl-CoA epimerase